jgi:hypothetical protein
VDLVLHDDPPQQWEMTAAYDGRDYPVTTNPAADMISMKHTTATEGESTFTKSCRVMAVNRRALSRLLRFR